MKKFLVFITLAFAGLLNLTVTAAPFIQFELGATYFGFHVYVDKVEKDGYKQAEEPVKCFLRLEYYYNEVNLMNRINVNKFEFDKYTPDVTIEFTDNTSVTLKLDTCQYFHRSWYDTLLKKRKNEYFSWGYYPLTDNIFQGKTIKSVKLTTQTGELYGVANINEEKKWEKISRELSKSIDKAIKETEKTRKRQTK